MDSGLLARLGLTRLRLPVPTAKFAVLHAGAEVLQGGEQGEIFWDALIQWISELELESEVLEALCIPVLAKHANYVAVDALQHAITRPSPLSDFFLSEISDRPLLVNSWVKAHSGEVPPLFSAQDILEELTAGRIVPPILVNRLKILEERSRQPFLKQWSYEFQRQLDKLGEQSDGYWQYFIEGDNERSTGQFITRRGHLARSAYLRTLSLAFDCWEMPDEVAYRESMYATPADLTFLKMLPGEPPYWTNMLYNSTPVSQDEWQRLLISVIQTIAEDDTGSELLHLNLPLASTVTYQAQVELISCLCDGNVPHPQPEEAFAVHEFLPGRVELPRTRSWDITVEQQTSIGPFPCSSDGQVFAALLPCVARYVGYLHSDLIGRMPYLPANYSRQATLLAQPRLGGMDLLFGSRPAGEVRYWNWQWSPTYDRALGPHCGMSLTLSRECCRELLSSPGMMICRFWRATVLTRETEYGKWEEKTLVGVLP